MPVFGNPLGLLALLGIPAVLAIHFLQRKAVTLPVSTLFLLERTHREAAGGRRVDRLIPSLPMWMQLLAVLLLAWLLAEPRFPHAQQVQRVAVVLDSSASMEAFRTKWLPALTEEISEMRGLATEVELTVMESMPGRPRLYSGTWPGELAARLETWRPRDGLHDPGAALRLARSLVSREGAVLYLTDTPWPDAPVGVTTLAIGEAVENTGFTGLSFVSTEDGPMWQALVKNHGTAPARREWWIESATSRSQAATLELAPGAWTTLQGIMPAEERQVRLRLSPDGFPLDDVLPMLAPRPKTLRCHSSPSPAHAALAERLLGALEAVESVGPTAEADWTLASHDPLDPAATATAGPGLWLVEDGTSAGSYLTGGILAEPHPLMNGLNWQSLLVRETLRLEPAANDTVLLWQEERPLLILRPQGTGPGLLIVNFDIRHSNAEKLPAFLLLLHRHIEGLREARIAPAALNLETGQPLRIAREAGRPLDIRFHDAEGKARPVPEEARETAGGRLRAPLEPGFAEYRQGDTELLQAALHFADAREADFRACATARGGTAESSASRMQRQTKADPWWRPALLLLLPALLLAWKFTRRNPSEEASAPAALSGTSP
jgi:hypothetical protein